jgi:hypothetical protein
MVNNETSLLSTAVTWSVTNGTKTETKITGGKLYVDKDETVSPLTIKATSDADSGKSATWSVTVSSVTSVTVSGATVSRGSYTTLSAEVTGVNSPSQTVTWIITSTGHATETSINSNGKLDVAPGETNSSITVKATSVEDDRISGTATVQIPTVTGVTVTPSTAEVAKGGSTTFIADVAASGGAVETVTWSVVTTGVSANTKFPNPTTSGLFQVASDETKTSITIKATSTADGSKSGTATVTVPQYTVSGVELSPSSAVGVKPGNTQNFSATVMGTNSPPQTVTWTIEGTHNTGTTITTGGYLTVASGETATTFTVKATSTADTSKSGEVTVYTYDPHSIKAKFGITTTGTTGVTDTFNALSTFISGGGLTNDPTKVQLGDYIDLEGGLSVGSYSISSGTEQGQASWRIYTTSTMTSNPNYESVYLRLIVVGINSFKGKNGNSKDHVVFQFQNIPFSRQMNSSATGSGGYAASGMRTYLTGNFLTGLTSAGVPDSVLWAPKRLMATGSSGSGTTEIEDKLWLPTEREMFGIRSRSNNSAETEANQARLDYYYNGYTNGYSRRIKYASSAFNSNGEATGGGSLYWEASPSYTSSASFCLVDASGSLGISSANNFGGCVPAFCVAY